MTRLLRRLYWPIAVLIVSLVFASLFILQRQGGELRLARLYETGDASYLNAVAVSGALVARTSRFDQSFLQTFRIDSQLTGEQQPASLRFLAQHEREELTQAAYGHAHFAYRDDASYYLDGYPSDGQNYLRIRRQDALTQRDTFAFVPVDLKTVNSPFVISFSGGYTPSVSLSPWLKNALVWIEGSAYGVTPAGQYEDGCGNLFRIDHWGRSADAAKADAAMGTILTNLPETSGWLPISLLTDGSRLLLVGGWRASADSGYVFKALEIDQYSLDGQLQNQRVLAADFDDVESVALSGKTLSVTIYNQSHLFVIGDPAAGGIEYWGTAKLLGDETGPSHQSSYRIGQIIGGKAYLLDIVYFRPVLADDYRSVTWGDGFVLTDLPWPYPERAQLISRQDLRLTVFDQAGKTCYQAIFDCGLNDDTLLWLAEDTAGGSAIEERQVVNLALEEVVLP